MRRVTLGCLILWTIVSAGCGGRSLTATTALPSSSPAWLSELACHTATTMHDPSPSSIVYVQGGHEEAERIASGDVVYDDAPVYLVVLTGDFVAEHSGPPGATTTSGHVAHLTVGRDSHDVLDTGIGERLPDLSPLGTPRTLPTDCG